MTKPFLLKPPLVQWTSAQILQKFAIEDGNRNIFQIGCCSRRITIFSQQQRALNLAWALQDAGLLENRRIIVIGAGFAGITLSMALKALGHQDFHLFDRSGHALHLQRGNLTRFIQPYMYDWPFNGCGYPRTELPYLNWWSSNAGELADTILKQWTRLNIPIHEKDAFKVRSGSPVIVLWHDGTTDQADLVVLAPGVGLERGVSETATLSYWNNDSLAQSHLGKKVPASVLVSGPGDGGLIDAIRASVSDFNHKNFVRDFIHNQEMHDSFVAASIQGNQNAANWDQIAFPPKLLARLRAGLRKDTTVFFNASDDWFISEHSSLFNRLIVAMLLQLGELTFVPGKLTHRFRPFGKWWVVIENERQSFSILRPDHLVIRHGPIQECPPLISKRHWKSTLRKWKRELDHPAVDVTSHRHHPDDFLLDRFSKIRGELDYEIVFLCSNPADAQQLIQQIKTAATAPRQVKTSVFTGTQRPEFLQHPALWPTATALFLRVTTTSRQNLNSFMANINRAYYSFGIQVLKERIFTPPTEVAPFVRYLFPGPAIELTFSGTRSAPMWVRVIQRLPAYPLRDAHNLLDADAFLEIARKKWTLERMISVGWRLTASSTENWRSFFDHQ